MDPRVRFLSRGNGYSLFLTNREAVLALSRTRSATPRVDSFTSSTPGADFKEDTKEPDVVRMRLQHAQDGQMVSGIDELAGTTSYFIGNDPAQWHSGIPTYAKVKYTAIYPGIDLVYYGNQQELEYDFVVAPGADPNLIRLQFAGVKNLVMTSDGILTVATRHSNIAMHKPAVYQIVNGRRQPVDGQFSLLARNSVGFHLGAYDHAQPLIIDPVLVFSTYLGGSGGGSGGDRVNGVAVDASGYVYVTGEAVSTDFPVTQDAFQTGNSSGIPMAFVAKFNPSGTQLLYSTYIGGSPAGHGSAIAVDGAGDAFITGQTQASNFPVTPGAFQTTNNAGIRGSAFVTEVNPSGTALIYSTYLGGSEGSGTGITQGNAIALDTSGEAYVTGYTGCGDFPVTAGAFQTVNGVDAAGGALAFVTKLNLGGTALVYSTFLGGATGSDYATGLAVNSAGEAYLTGYTYATDFPVSQGAFQFTMHADPSVGTNAFVTALNSTGTGLIYSSYLGGSFNDQGIAIALDTSGNAYVTGDAASTDFPVTSGAFQTTFNGLAGAAFVTKINSTGSALVYSTYLGLTDVSAFGIAVDSLGQAYVTGNVDAGNALQLTPGAFITSYNSRSAFLTEFNAAGSALLYSTYFAGSAGTTTSAGIALNPSSGNPYIAGQTAASDLPVSAGAFQTANNAAAGGGPNGYVAGFAIGSPKTPVGDFAGSFASGTASANPGAQTTYALTVTSSGGFDSGVTLSVSNLPAGVTGGFSPVLVPGGSGTSTLTLTTSTTTPPGIYYFTATGTSGPLVHSTTLELLVGTVDFTGTATPGSQTVSVGATAQYNIALSTVGTLPFGNNVTLSVSGLPAGVTASFSNPTVSPDANGTSVLSLVTSSTTPLGSYSITLTGTGGGVTHGRTIGLVVTSAAPTTGDFSGSFNPGAGSANPGGQAIYGLTVTPSGGFTGSVVLSVSNLPPGVTGGFSPSVVSGGSGISTLTLNVSSTTPLGIYEFTVAGVSGSLMHSTTLELLVGTVDFTGTITPPTQTVAAGNTAPYTISLSTVGTAPFGGNVTLSVSGLPAGVTASFSSPSISPDANGSSVLTLATSSSTPPGTYSLVITGTGQGVTHSKAFGLTVITAPLPIAESILYTFTGNGAGTADGWSPTGGLVMDNQGNLYGTTKNGGGANNDGTVFKISPSGQETILHSFAGYPDGVSPNGGMVMDSAGNLYGTTTGGGSNPIFCGEGLECGAPGGAVFKVAPDGTETLLHSFLPSNTTDGENPYQGLITDGNGNLYGTTSNSGNSTSCGTVFQLTTGGAYTVLYSFSGPDGCNPGGDDITGASGGGPGLVMDANGNVFGTTYIGGAYGHGVLFKLSNGIETVLHSFGGNATDGSGPLGGLALDSQGNIYGVTVSGANSAVIYKVSSAGTESVLYSFSDFDFVQPGLVIDSHQNILGAIAGDGPNYDGYVFALAPTGVLTLLHDFPSSGGGKDGIDPQGGPLLANGNLYATTSSDGTYSSGTVFELSPSTTAPQAPVFSVLPGTYSSQQTITITAAPGATIYYSLGGIARPNYGPMYNGPITISSTSFLSAVAVSPDGTVSPTIQALYTITPAP